jgi:hypothetical protein
MRIYPAMSRIWQFAPEAKVFWFFSSEKNRKESSFAFRKRSEKTLFPVLRQDFWAVLGRHVSIVKIAEPTGHRVRTLCND